MAAILTPLPYDSALLGFPVARLETAPVTAAELADVGAAATTVGVRLLYLVLPPENTAANAAAEAAGAWLADRKATFLLPLAGAPAVAPPDTSITATHEVTPALEALALQSGEYSRFQRDPRFPSAAFETLYRQWLHRSLDGSLARVVLTAQAAPNQPELALLTLGEKNGRADIGLLAVDSRARRQYLGHRLVQAARQQARAWGYSEMQVVTQLDNGPACRFYEACGFQLAQVAHVYHWWLG